MGGVVGCGGGEIVNIEASKCHRRSIVESEARPYHREREKQQAKHKARGERRRVTRATCDERAKGDELARGAAGTARAQQQQREKIERERRRVVDPTALT